MTAFPRAISRAPAHRAAMARDLLGYAALAPAPVTHHLTLPPGDTSGPLGVCDATWAAGAEALAHVHAGEDELFVVLSGEVELTVAGRRLRLGPGAPAFVPRGTEHGFRALTEARVLALLSRQGFEAPLPAP